MREYLRKYMPKYRKEHPEYDIKTHAKWNQRLLRFKNKRITLEQNPRTGVCSICRKQGKTDMHHLQYDENDPLAHTIELCVPCHNKQRIGSVYNLG